MWELCSESENAEKIIEMGQYGKQQRNARSNYAPLERTVLRTQSVTEKNTTFSHLQRARIVRSSPNFARR